MSCVTASPPGSWLSARASHHRKAPRSLASSDNCSLCVSRERISKGVQFPGRRQHWNAHHAGRILVGDLQPGTATDRRRSAPSFPCAATLALRIVRGEIFANLTNGEHLLVCHSAASIVAPTGSAEFRIAMVTVFPVASTVRIRSPRTSDCSIDVPTQDPATSITSSELFIRRPTFP